MASKFTRSALLGVISVCVLALVLSLIIVLLVGFFSTPDSERNDAHHVTGGAIDASGSYLGEGDAALAAFDERYGFGEPTAQGELLVNVAGLYAQPDAGHMVSFSFVDENDDLVCASVCSCVIGSHVNFGASNFIYDWVNKVPIESGLSLARVSNGEAPYARIWYWEYPLSGWAFRHAHAPRMAAQLFLDDATYDYVVANAGVDAEAHACGSFVDMGDVSVALPFVSQEN